MKKRMFVMLLAALITASTVSCGKTEQAPVTTSDTTMVVETTEDTETQISLGIPKEDNGGRNFHILVPTEKAYEFVTETTGESVNDAVYNRSLKTEEHFNIKFTYQYEDGGWDFRNTYTQFITQAVLANDATYDLATGFLVCVMPIITSGTLSSWATQEDLNLDNPWWIANQYDNMNIYGQQFACIGDANLSMYKDCSVVYFNKRVLENFNLENPYTLVRENKWTIEKLLEMSEAVVQDLDGDGSINPEVDAIGNYIQGVPLRVLQAAMDMKVIVRDDNQNPVVTDLTDRFIRGFELGNLFLERDDIYVELQAVDFYQFPEIFATDRSLFHMSFLYALEGETMRNMDADFGLVPYPKLDESQENFITQIGTSSNANFLPKTCSDPSLTCRVMETLAYYSMCDVIPTYYNIALENKYTRDADVPEMLDLIRESMTTSFDFTYSTMPSINGINALYQLASGNIASYFASKQESWTTGLETIMEALE